MYKEGQLVELKPGVITYDSYYKFIPSKFLSKYKFKKGLYPPTDKLYKIIYLNTHPDFPKRLLGVVTNTLDAKCYVIQLTPEHVKPLSINTNTKEFIVKRVFKKFRRL